MEKRRSSVEINNTSENILERIPLYQTTDDLDREEGIEINAMKATHKSPIPVKDLSENDDIDKTAFVTSVDFLLNWARKSSIFPAQFGLACCAFEMIASAASRIVGVSSSDNAASFRAFNSASALTSAACISSSVGPSELTTPDFNNWLFAITAEIPFVIFLFCYYSLYIRVV